MFLGLANRKSVGEQLIPCGPTGEPKKSLLIRFRGPFSNDFQANFQSDTPSRAPLGPQVGALRRLLAILGAPISIFINSLAHFGGMGLSLESILASLGHLWAQNASKMDPRSLQNWRNSCVRQSVNKNLQKSMLPNMFFSMIWCCF